MIPPRDTTLEDFRVDLAAAPDEAHELKREQDSGRRFHGRWKGEAQSPQSLLNV